MANYNDINDINDIEEVATVKIMMLKGDKGDKGDDSYDDTEVRGLISAEALTRERADASMENSIESMQSTVDDAVADVGDMELALAVERARIDEIIASGTGTVIEKTLFTGSAQGTGKEIALSDPVADFDYLDIYTWKQGDKPVFTIPAVVTASGADPISLEFPNVADSTNNTQMWIGEIQITVQAQKLTIANQFSWFWSGQSSASATWAKINAQSGTLVQYEPYVYKVVGRKLANNEEVEDIRIGADGVTYQSAGTAVRTQLNKKMDKVTNAVAGHIVIFDSNGNAVDSGVALSDLI